MKVMVTDGQYPHTLGAVRTLARKGCHVIVGASSRLAQCFYSRYCHAKVLYPPPERETEFIDDLLRQIRQSPPDVLLPIGYRCTTAISKRKDEFVPYCKVPVADWPSMEVACLKDRTFELARQVGLGVPHQYSTRGQVDRFPVVVKGVKDSGNLRYVNSRQELDSLAADDDAVIQEYIPGEGYGFYALFNHGQIRAIFMHRRLREYPITGGGSTAAESVYDDDLRQLGTRILTALKWHGVAMVEFKKDARTGKFMLMEINPKFWGSLDLSISCGVDFPYLAARMAMDGDVEPVMQYPIGRRFRWLLPNDTMHVLANPRAAWPFVRDFFDPNTSGNIRLRDPLPALVQLAMTGRNVAKALVKGQLRYPHGRPMVQP